MRLLVTVAPPPVGPSTQNCGQQGIGGVLAAVLGHRPCSLATFVLTPILPLNCQVALDKSLPHLEVIFHVLRMGSWYVKPHHEDAVGRIQNVGNDIKQSYNLIS